jgi:putative oxidoreductase
LDGTKDFQRIAFSVPISNKRFNLDRESMKKILFSNKAFAVDVALLILRVAVSILILTHGWAKIANFSENLNRFPDPIGLGVATTLQLTIFAEFFCAILVGLGFMTRLALIPLLINMAIIVFVVHSADPFSRQELPLLYLISFLFLFFTGPGRFSMDGQILKKERY